ncbi:MAG TPA: multicopper oxidase domain-containing protein [Terriglobia bacterium]|nr:multicopper oxidase domain-containing protein [Terriglobia bacterium]
MNRRQFLLGSASTLALLANRQRGYAYATSRRLDKFIQPIRRFGPDIPVLSPDTTTYPGIDYYSIEAGVFRDVLHPSFPNGTRLYGYRQTGSGTYRHLGGAIVARKNRPVRIRFTCSLPQQHILPFDTTVSEGPGGLRADRAVIHLHGGRVPWASDGGPFQWVANAAFGAQTGASVPVPGWLPNEVGGLTNDHFYPNNQSARFMWFHDHASGITRTNAYAGLASGYFLIDDIELAMGLPIPGDALVIQDKVFYDPFVDPEYASYAGPAVLGGAGEGDLWYPYVYDPAIWDLEDGGEPLPTPSAVAEMFGDTMLVNGTVYPFQEVNGMKRFRVLNACNSRFLNLSFAVEDPAAPGTIRGEARARNVGAPIWAPVRVWQIGNECGFLPQPVLLADTVSQGRIPPTPLLLGPAERADLIVDFSAVPVGMNVILYNDAAAPFPDGGRDFDAGWRDRRKESWDGPDSRTIMQFRRVAGAGDRFPIPMPAAGTTLVPVLPTTPDTENGGFKLDLTPGSVVDFNGSQFQYLEATQDLTLNESFDRFGRLAQLIGNLADSNGGAGLGYLEGPGEHVAYGTIQIWNIYNNTADTHPMHFHLFNVMLLRRRLFRVNSAGKRVFTGQGRAPAPNESGWKETVRMNPGECTTVAVLVENPFELPEQSSGVKGAPAARTFSWKKSDGTVVTSSPVPSSPRLAGSFGINADEYVWHCHILEHEEHDMMRTLNAV